MMILIGIILTFVGIGFYEFFNKDDKSNVWLCMLGFFTMLVGVLVIAMSLGGEL